MTPHRFFADGPVLDAGILPLTPGDVHHIRDVLRLTGGDEIIVVAAGVPVTVRITAVGSSIAGDRIGREPHASLPPVWIVQGVAKGERMDQLVRQTTELGVARIIPVVTERTVVRLEPAKAAERASRWRRVAAEAAKQAQRTSVPEVDIPVRLEVAAATLADACGLVCWEDASGAPGIDAALAEAVPGPSVPVAVVVGPEGGFTAAEVGVLTSAGARVVSLGGTVLRTETAAVVAVALALHARGALGAARG